MEQSRLIDADNIKMLISESLKKEGVDETAANHVADGLVHASLRGVDSHGIRLLPHYLKGLKAGRINPAPRYEFNKNSAAAGVLDADDAFGHAAGMEAVKHAVAMAEEAGIGAVAVKRSTHFGAASFFALDIAQRGMIGMSFTNADSLIVPTAAKSRFLGNNPICFTAPCEGEDPICLDMATSVITFNKVLQLKEENKPIPPGAGADAEGLETTDAEKVVQLLPVGGYKGYGLSFMVEVFCALLTGMPFGPHIPRMYDAPIHEKRNLGHFVMAMNIEAFIEPGVFKYNMKQMVSQLRNAPAVDAKVPVQVAGDPEKKTAEERLKNGIPLRPVDVAFYKQVAKDYDLPLF